MHCVCSVGGLWHLDKTSLQKSHELHLFGRGFVALGQNQFAEAHAYFKEVVDLNPTNAVVSQSLESYFSFTRYLTVCGMLTTVSGLCLECGLQCDCEWSLSTV